MKEPDLHRHYGSSTEFKVISQVKVAVLFATAEILNTDNEVFQKTIGEQTINAGTCTNQEIQHQYQQCEPNYSQNYQESCERGTGMDTVLDNTYYNAPYDHQQYMSNEKPNAFNSYQPVETRSFGTTTTMYENVRHAGTSMVNDDSYWRDIETQTTAYAPSHSLYNNWSNE
ncbi:unnamed protein product [Caenorhabditis bovis]|uniref:Uncharacterized protein n=1 Tax=Caenorhabditis bovis TaxID=2654633 RepID=A0A8S1FA62_9PELO|nr:unnamed protein product [Caenorhabditis bovis]